MSEPAPTPAVPATPETLSAFVTFDRLYYAGKVAINPAHVLLARANAEDTYVTLHLREGARVRVIGSLVTVRERLGLPPESELDKTPVL